MLSCMVKQAQQAIKLRTTKNQIAESLMTRNSRPATHVIARVICLPTKLLGENGQHFYLAVGFLSYY